MGYEVETYGGGKTVALGRVRLPVSDAAWAGVNETPDVTVLSFQRRAFEVVPRGASSPFVVGPGSVTVTRRPLGYYRRAIDEGGEETDWLWVEPGLGERLLHGVPAQASRWALPGRVLLAQRRLFARARAGLDLSVESEAVGLASAVCAALGASGVDGGVEGGADGAARDRVALALELLARDVRGELTLAAVSDAMELSPSHACVVFKRVTGMTLGEASRAMRLAVGLDRVLGGGAPLSRLAMELGFCSPSHFAARFRACFGVTAREARAMVG